MVYHPPFVPTKTFKSPQNKHSPPKNIQQKHLKKTKRIQNIHPAKKTPQHTRKNTIAEIHIAKDLKVSKSNIPNKSPKNEEEKTVFTPPPSAEESPSVHDPQLRAPRCRRFQGEVCSRTGKRTSGVRPVLSTVFLNLGFYLQTFFFFWGIG